MQFITTRISAVAIPKDNPIFGESVTHIELCNDALDFYIKLSQTYDEIEKGVVTFNNADEILAIGNVAKEMMRDAEKAMKE
jgi:hypothetical protein